ncbi:hypothetical protein AAY473_025257 [Plecturocebus cupreus]
METEKESESRRNWLNQGLALSPRLECRGADHNSLQPSRPPVSASLAAGTTGTRHHAWLIFKNFFIEMKSHYVAKVEDLDCVVACPELAATGAEEVEALEDPAEAASAASTLLPHRAQESS